MSSYKYDDDERSDLTDYLNLRNTDADILKSHVARFGLDIEETAAADHAKRLKRVLFDENTRDNELTAKRYAKESIYGNTNNIHGNNQLLQFSANNMSDIAREGDVHGRADDKSNIESTADNQMMPNYLTSEQYGERTERENYMADTEADSVSIPATVQKRPFLVPSSPTGDSELIQQEFSFLNSYLGDDMRTPSESGPTTEEPMYSKPLKRSSHEIATSQYHSLAKIKPEIRVYDQMNINKPSESHSSLQATNVAGKNNDNSFPMAELLHHGRTKAYSNGLHHHPSSTLSSSKSNNMITAINEPRLAEHHDNELQSQQKLERDRQVYENYNEQYKPGLTNSIYQNSSDYGHKPKDKNCSGDSNKNRTNACRRAVILTVVGCLICLVSAGAGVGAYFLTKYLVGSL